MPVILINKRVLAVVSFLLVYCSCATMRDRDTIPDYVIREGGMTVPGSAPLNAFIFEDTRQDVSFQAYLVYKYRMNDTRETEFPVTISNTKFRILYYEHIDFEKFFRSSDYIPTVTVTAEQGNLNKPRFVAVSMVDDANQDCLSEKSLWYAIATDHLKKLKDEYLANANR